MNLKGECVKSGKVCADLNCQGDFYCQMADDAFIDAKCVAKIKNNDKCDPKSEHGENVSCESGLCNPAGETCTAGPQTCANLNCNDDSYCQDGADQFTDAKCLNKIHNTHQCDPKADGGVNNSCKSNLCDTNNNICVAVPKGKTCDGISCQAGEYCRDQSEFYDAQCLAQRDQGQKCDMNAHGIDPDEYINPSCKGEFMTCNPYNNVCQPPGTACVGCDDTQYCWIAPNIFDNDVCKPLIKNGQKCDTASVFRKRDSCESFFCNAQGLCGKCSSDDDCFAVCSAGVCVPTTAIDEVAENL